MTRTSVRAVIALTCVLMTGCNDNNEDNNHTMATTSVDMGEEGMGGPGVVDYRDQILTRRSGDCADYVGTYMAAVGDVMTGDMQTSMVEIMATDDACMFDVNSIPNHDYQDGMARFATPVSPVERTFSVPRMPQMAAQATQLTLRTYNGLMLNGIVVDLLAAGCFGVGDGRIGCFDTATPYRFDPMSPMTNFGTDTHNAHTQPDGTYHYHGNPMALFDENPGADGSPVIGFAADGFPIYGSFFKDDTGTVRKATSGYTLKEGMRDGGPGGAFDGTYVDDYEFTGGGDLDECNGMTVDGQYGYYVTDTYPWVLKCFKGVLDPSFSKGMGMR
ncbi:MAG: YHYH protein [Myxococcota bacterium]